MNRIPIYLLLVLALAFKVTNAQVKKPISKAKPVALNSGLSSSVQRGKMVYNSLCLACHQADGGGVPNLNAPLIQTTAVLGDKSKLINILLKGMQGVEIDGESYSNAMPPVSHLSNQEIADVLTYVRNNFGNKASQVTLGDVNAVRPKK